MRLRSVRLSFKIVHRTSYDSTLRRIKKCGSVVRHTVYYSVKTLPAGIFERARAPSVGAHGIWLVFKMADKPRLHVYLNKVESGVCNRPDEGAVKSFCVISRLSRHQNAVRNFYKRLVQASQIVLRRYSIPQAVVAVPEPKPFYSVGIALFIRGSHPSGNFLDLEKNFSSGAFPGFETRRQQAPTLWGRRSNGSCQLPRTTGLNLCPYGIVPSYTTLDI